MTAVVAPVVPDAAVVVQAHGIAGRVAVLQGFDRLRREIAASAGGHRSVFLGYDELELVDRPWVDGAVILHATVVATDGHRQTVRYTATDASVGQEAGPLARGRGVTALRG